MLRRSSVLIAYVVALLAPGVVHQAEATEAANLKIPPNPWGCTLCHAAPSVTPTEVPVGAVTPLTEIGLSWFQQAPEEANRLWSELALGNVDGDGCSNGFELGDPTGAFLPEGELPPDRSVSDPNENDCSLPISEESWSRLKSLFDGN